MAHITRGKLQKFDLSRKGIKDLINEIDGLKQSVKGELQDGATLYVAKQAKQTVESHLKGSIASSVEVRQPEHRGGRTRVTIANTNPNAVYWEYGTGINGYNHSYEDETGEQPPIAWEYMSGETVVKDPANPHYGEWPFSGHWNPGQRAHAGWYHAKQEVEDNLAWWANEYIQGHL